MDRRSFLSRTLSLSALPFNALLERNRIAHTSTARLRWPNQAPYGPLVETRDVATGLPLLLLPNGFQYVSFGWAGDPLDGGGITPGAHDGMAAFRSRGDRIDIARNHEAAFRGRHDRIYIVRNHEVGAGTPFGPVAYDPAAAGGTTTIEFDSRRGQFLGAYASLSGTLRNCAGGKTPWGSWLTCEETTDYRTMPHGYVFEIPAGGFGHPVPIRDMGRFRHEALAVDRRTGDVYETEDSDNTSGFYRFVPRTRGNLADGGTLFMLRVNDDPLADLGGSFSSGTTFTVDWVRIEQPDDPGVSVSRHAVWSQGRAEGAATFANLEGCWYDDGSVYFVASRGGVGFGQVWQYRPATETLTLVFESPGPDVLDRPDNITVSPRGGIVLCEDGSADQHVHGLTVYGEVFPFAKNNVRLNGERSGLTGDYTGSEFAGACYSPDGRWLFVNVQNPGITFAITGAWGDGAL